MNPAVPDELAAILGRMMAKDPRERYQRPEHLVQHLLQLAQKLGAGGQSDGVLFVDAPLPAPPRMRPMIVAGVAASLLTCSSSCGMSTWPTNGPPGGRVVSRPSARRKTRQDKNPGGIDDAPVVPVFGPAARPHRCCVRAELAEALATKSGDTTSSCSTTSIWCQRGMDPGRMPEMILVGGKRELTIQPRRPANASPSGSPSRRPSRTGAGGNTRGCRYRSTGRIKISGVRFDGCSRAPYW